MKKVNLESIGFAFGDLVSCNEVIQNIPHVFIRILAVIN